ncbi:MAG: acetyl-CoA carboxylase biotin carboxyl carrier protein subunit, partial [Clostridiales bacterium]|nr:acetyl-CoA carboxylase biotin carboxyl carrier protein subunit [Clostridiales bacterium]
MKKFLIKVNGNPYEVEVEELGGQLTQQPAAQAAPAVTAAPAAAPAAPAAQAAAPAPAAKAPAANGPAGATKISCPMPGTILKINVNPGDKVKKNQVLLILE